MQSRNLIERAYAEFQALYVGDFRQDIPLYLDLAAKYPGPVLEVGCGTGRLLARLAECGYDVYGIDVSRPMLEIARRRTEPWAERVQLRDFDLRNSTPFEKFHVVFVTLHHFNQLIDIEEQRLFLRHLARCMASPGILAIDLFCPLGYVQPESNGKWRELERTVNGRELKARDRRELLTPLLERRTQIFSVDGKPPLEWVTHRRYLPAQQAAQMVLEAGFESVRYLENYELASARAIGEGERPLAPYQLIAER